MPTKRQSSPPYTRDLVAGRLQRGRRGGDGGSAQLSIDVTVAADGTLYIADGSNHRDPESGHERHHHHRGRDGDGRLQRGRRAGDGGPAQLPRRRRDR